MSNGLFQQLEADFQPQLQQWDPEPLVRDILEYYTHLGNVQMCVTVLLVLQKVLTFDIQHTEPYFWAYLDMLKRCRMWNVATTVINSCPLTAIRLINQESTLIHTSCPRCHKPIMQNPLRPSWSCESCRRLLDGCVIWGFLHGVKFAGMVDIQSVCKVGIDYILLFC
eukprot:jgi/Hompol1/5095/HPOL_000491-RA